MMFLLITMALAVALVFQSTHYQKRLNKAFWEWVREQNIKGIIDSETINELGNEFDKKTEGLITINDKEN